MAKPPKRQSTSPPTSTLTSIKTPQSLVHVRHNISLLQYKYWLLLLREFRNQLDQDIPASEGGLRFVSVATITDAIGYQPRRADLIDDLGALVGARIGFNLLLKDGEKADYGAGFISEWMVAQGRIAFKLPSKLEEAVRGLEAPKAMFQRLNWGVFNRLSGKHEAVIYKLCKDYIGVRRTPKMSIAQFRHYMGIDDDEYTEFMTLNNRVIRRPCQRLNQSEICDITVEPVYEKVGRKVVGLHFVAEYRKSTEAAREILSPDVVSDQPTSEHATGVDPCFLAALTTIETATQLEYLALRSSDAIALCIERANEYALTQTSQGKTVNYGGLYRKSITEGWHLQHAEKKRKIATARAAGAQRAAAAQVSQIAEQQELSAAAARTAHEIAEFLLLPDPDKQYIRQAFRSTLPASMHRLFDRNTEDSILFRNQFATFLTAMKSS